MSHFKARLEIGKVTSPHGLKGALRFMPWCDDLSVFDTISNLYDKNGVKYSLLSWSIAKNLIIICLDTIDTIDKAESLRNAIFEVERDEMPELPEGDYYLEDILGCEVVSITGERLGIISDWLDNGFQKVYIIKRAEGSDILIPAVDEFIKQVDIDNKKVVVELIEGLVDDEI